MEPIEINNPEDDLVIEIPYSEYEAMTTLAVKIAEQNSIVLGSIGVLQSEIKTQVETFMAVIDAIKIALSEQNINIDMPPLTPMITVQPAELPAPIVNVKIPDRKKKVIIKVERDRDGRMSGATGTIE